MTKVYYGDCLKILPTLEKEFVDFTITDIPYNTTEVVWDNKISLCDMWKQLNRINKNFATTAIHGTEPFASYLRLSNIKHYKYDWYWNKHLPSNFQIMKHCPGKILENICIFSKGKIPHNGKSKMFYNPQGIQKVIGKGRSGNIKVNLNFKPRRNQKVRPYIHRITNYPNHIIDIHNCFRKDHLHPTQKPVELISYLIKTYSNEGDTILDFTCGSGTTGISAQETKRNAILIEKNPLWYNITIRRLKGEDTKDLKKYINLMRDKYGKYADFKAPLQFNKEYIID